VYGQEQSASRGACFVDSCMYTKKLKAMVYNICTRLAVKQSTVKEKQSEPMLVRRTTASL